MIRRLFWMLVGSALTLFALRKLSRASHAFTPEGIAERVEGRVSELEAGARAFAAEVRDASRGREAELRAAMAAAARPRRATGPVRASTDQGTNPTNRHDNKDGR
ncbi:DUF6167 family protein [Allonocardiopsis opalescens]|uniref:Secreted protein n=1 Tax=Allonocardiopsis opalescens TaxID=1144618 RepID=A0A2T0PXA8_9ACTN|nr:DUF6167 family protein [Allonocardiopsis opalescens]PRX96026.1 hypothetical protein CLV72_10830 [Allonocardiopsis opalescens]